MYLTSKVRMNRLFKQGRCLDVAIDTACATSLHF